MFLSKNIAYETWLVVLMLLLGFEIEVLPAVIKPAASEAPPVREPIVQVQENTKSPGESGMHDGFLPTPGESPLSDIRVQSFIELTCCVKSFDFADNRAAIIVDKVKSTRLKIENFVTGILFIKKV